MVVKVSLLMVLMSIWDSVMPIRENTPSIASSTLDVDGVCMLNDWISCNDDFCADNGNYFQFKLKGKGRSGAATQVVDVPDVQLHRCCSSVDGLTFLAVYTGTRPGVPPPSGRGRGGGDAGSLLPGVLPPN